MTRLEDMTTAEIAEAVDAQEYRRGLHHRFICITRSGALTLFLFQYLLLLRMNLLWIVGITIAALIVELRTNRFALTTYSTSQIVDLLLKRASLVRPNRSLWKPFAGGFLLWLTGAVAYAAGISTNACHAAMFSGAALVMWFAKSADLIKHTSGTYFDFSDAGYDRVHVQVRPSGNADEFLLAKGNPILDLPRLSLVYAALPIILLFTFVFFLIGGVDTVDDGQVVIYLAPLISSTFGCGVHEPARFHLVQKELERLAESTKRNGAR